MGLRALGRTAAALLLALGCAAAASIWWLDRSAIGPGALARHLDAGSASGHPWRDRIAGAAAVALLRLDRSGAVTPIPLDRLPVGAAGVAARAHQREVAVADSAALRQAIAGARAGDLIRLAPGRYRIAGERLQAAAPGTERWPVTVRADRPGGATLEVDASEGVVVSGPFWRFEQLAIRGVCPDHSACEHAFHVVGGGHHFAAVGNTIVDFNAHIKINGVDGRFPDYGTIERNTFDNSAPRRTPNPVTPIDLVGASHWIIRHNLIADFVKSGGDRTSYGAFAKGAGTHNVFEANVVWCERRLRGLPGQRIGLSLGGGGSEAAYCRDGRCTTEQDSSVIAANLVAACSDDGIYLNSSTRSQVLHNTVLDTGGVSARYPTTSADLEGNLIDGPIRVRSGAIVRDVDNRSVPLAWRYLGYRPGWAGASPPPRRAAGAPVAPGLCGTPRPATPAYGALDEFAACTGSPSTD